MLSEHVGYLRIAVSTYASQTPCEYALRSGSSVLGSAAWPADELLKELSLAAACMQKPCEHVNIADRLCSARESFEHVACCGS